MGNWPWTHPVEGGSADPKYCYCCTSIQKTCKCIGFSRRRIGRGGRIMFDRAYTPYDVSSPTTKLTSGHDPGPVNGIVTFPERVPPWYVEFSYSLPLNLTNFSFNPICENLFS